MSSVAEQHYPQRLTEHLIVDPGDPALRNAAENTVRHAVEAFMDHHRGRRIRVVHPDHLALTGAEIRVPLPAGKRFAHRRWLDDLNAKQRDLPLPAGAERPLVSVVIPAYNEERYLEEALQSVLQQTYRRLQVVVVDDGSTDRTPYVLDRLARGDDRIEVVRQQNRGIVGALNRGLQAATGPFVARMDANDRIPAHRIEAQVDYLLRFDDVSVVSAWMSSMDESGRPLDKTWAPPTLPGVVGWALHFSTAVVHAAALAHRDVLIAAGGYQSEGVEHLEDYDLWARLLPHARMASLPEVLYHRREVTRGITFAHADAQAVGSQRVVRRLVSDLLGHPVAEADARDLFRLHRGLSVAPDRAGALADLVTKMHRRFVDRDELSATERALVAYDVGKKLVRLGRLAVAADPKRGARILTQALAASPGLLPVRAGQSVRRTLVQRLARLAQR